VKRTCIWRAICVIEFIGTVPGRGGGRGKGGEFGGGGSGRKYPFEDANVGRKRVKQTKGTSGVKVLRTKKRKKGIGGPALGNSSCQRKNRASRV